MQPFNFSGETLGSFILYSRAYCHLCNDMLEELHQFEKDYQFSVEIVDIDNNNDENLLKRYDELVPVLIGCDEQDNAVELCHYFLDQIAVREYLEKTQSIS
jgi:thiol-disulfide isomerase/thioredoxin